MNMKQRSPHTKTGILLKGKCLLWWPTTTTKYRNIASKNIENKNSNQMEQNRGNIPRKRKDKHEGIQNEWVKRKGDSWVYMQSVANESRYKVSACPRSSPPTHPCLLLLVPPHTAGASALQL